MKYSLYLLLISVILIGCGKPKEGPTGEQLLTKEQMTKLADDAKIYFKTVADKMPRSETDTPDMIALGEKLYNDKRLSLDNTISCNSCHLLDNNGPGVDNKPVSVGVGGKNGTRNSPTVLNAGFQFVQFWDGRAKDLVEQAKGPILNPVEMAMPNEKEVVKRFGAIPEYKDMFMKAFPSDKGTVSYDNIAKAIAAFERTLVTHDRFDDYLKGQDDVLSQEELKGLDLFISSGCTTCHTGSLLGGNIYQKMGLIHPYTDTVDKGRFAVTKAETDMYMFKVPMLRNISLTAPYFHDGKVATLEDAIIQMGWLQLNKKLTPEEAGYIAKFFNTLSDKKREKK
ncbi:MAG: cytochrome-c peroxidase [Bacteroidetes bacterium]|nr:MAG: cytochrome-c peroxidase [Bacteroidota bacterium]